MTATADELVDWMKGYVGYSEEGRSNRTVFAKMAGHANGYAWCATFVAAAHRKLGLPTPNTVLVGSSRTMIGEARRTGLGLPKSPATWQPGDHVHTKRGLPNLWLGHVGTILKVWKDEAGVWWVQSIEGNTNRKGSATGGSVLVHTRRADWWLLGAWRPPCAPPPRTRLLLRLVDERLIAWTGITSDGKRVGHHVGSIPEAEALLRAGFTQVDWPHQVVVQ